MREFFAKKEKETKRKRETKRERATGDAAGAWCRWSARAGRRDGRSSDQRTSDRADVDEGEGTVGVLAPGDRDAEGLEGYIQLTS